MLPMQSRFRGTQLGFHRAQLRFRRTQLDFYQQLLCNVIVVVYSWRSSYRGKRTIGVVQGSCLSERTSCKNRFNFLRQTDWCVLWLMFLYSWWLI